MGCVNKKLRGAVLDDNGNIMWYYCEFGICKGQNTHQYELAKHLGRHLREQHDGIGLPFYWKQGLREMECIDLERRKKQREIDLDDFLAEAKRRAAISLALMIKGRDNWCFNVERTRRRGGYKFKVPRLHPRA
jgi:hypothetical protein